MVGKFLKELIMDSHDITKAILPPQAHVPNSVPVKVTASPFADMQMPGPSLPLWHRKAKLCALLSGAYPWRFLRLPGASGWEPARHVVHVQGLLAVKKLAIGMVSFFSPDQAADHNRGHTAHTEPSLPASCLACGISATFLELNVPLSQDPPSV